MVHYPTKTGELSGILQHTRRLDARVWRDEGQERQRHLWPQDVMEDALWPRGADHRAQGDFAHELTRAFVDVFRYALPPYLERQRVSAADLTWVEPPPEDVRHERSTQAAVLASP